jgi:CSLREA domain-containing protein
MSRVRTRLRLAGMLGAMATAALVLPGGAAAVGRVPHFEKCSPGCDILVNSTNDAPDAHPGDGRCRTSAGKCTLRAAVQEANARKQADDKPWRVLVPGGHYTLTRHGLDDNASRGDLDLRFHGEVVGEGQSKTIVDGDHADRVFDLFGPDVRVAHLTVTDGLATDGPGGGIRTSGSGYSWVQYVLVDDNEAAAGDAPQAGYGGGLAGIGNPIVSDTTFTYNKAVNGGGIYWHAFEHAINFNAVIHNHATQDGGGVYYDAEDSDLFDDTISGNTAGQHGGGIYFAPNSSWLHVDFLTIASNTAATGLGGGVWRDVNPQVENTPRVASGTIIARNGVGKDCAGPGELQTHDSGNVDSDGSCWPGGDTDRSGVDPLIAAPAYNGGPTPTRALQPGSPAIDLAPCAADSGLVDQRGAKRPFGSACDSGAFEVGTCCPPPEKAFVHHAPPPPPTSYCGVIVRGTDGADVLVGNRRRNDIFGRGGNDRIFGRFQADCLHGGRGDDFIRGGNGTDVLRGNSGNDKLSGGDQEDTILGESGRDRILGGADDDKLYGGPGRDYIKGGGGFDTISGGPGNDVIDASGGGLDRVDCGSGVDRIRARRLEHLYNCEHVHYVG